MNSSLYNGISGIQSQQFGIEVWSNNITGINTAGFKASTPEFSNIFNQQKANSYFDSVSSGVGIGSTAQATTTNFSKGATIATESKYDLAINGDGWFGVTDKNGDKFYTRAGAFQKDRDGFLVDNEGNYVTGTSANNITGNIVKENPAQSVNYGIANEQAKIQIPDNLIIPSKPTTNVKFEGSLNTDITTKFSALSGKNEEVANIEIYRTNIIDANGDENSLEITLTKIVPTTDEGTTWTTKAIVKDSDKNPLSTKEGQISFNTRGAILSNTLTEIDNNGSPVTLNFGTFYNPSDSNSGFDGIVSLSGFKSERNTTKDGHKEGNLRDFGISDEGVVVANFDTGQTIPISKIAIYNFQNEAGLEQANPVYFKETANSGDAMFYRDKDGNPIQSANISNNKLEMSNVDLSSALTELLIMQKAFDASAKSITTSDQLIQNAINMKK
jgi:flagellar hook protein FlgE